MAAPHACQAATTDDSALFTPHRDTPRASTLFGALVIASPTPHTGGVLRFTKEEETWARGSGSVLARQSEPAIARAVFFSDTEHGVLPVTSGRRVTIM
jgi:hypothetical protein